MIGYPRGPKRYKLWDPAHSSVVISQNVRFDKSSSYCQAGTVSDTSNDVNVESPTEILEDSDRESYCEHSSNKLNEVRLSWQKRVLL